MEIAPSKLNYLESERRNPPLGTILFNGLWRDSAGR